MSIRQRACPRFQHIVPGKWKNRHGFRACPRLNLGTKRAVIPLGRKEIDKLRRIQELGYAKWSPVDIYAAAQTLIDHNIEEETIRLLEDNRINRALKTINISVWKLIRELYIDELSETLDVLNELEKAVAYLAFSGSGIPYIDNIRERLLDKMSSYDRSLLSNAEESLKEAGSNTVFAENEEKSLKEFNKIVEIAKVISYWFSTDKKETKVEKEMVSDEEVKQSLEGYLAGGTLEALRTSFKQVPRVRISKREIKWGPMKIIHTPLEHRPASRKGTLQETPLDRGVVMKYPHRLLLDSKIFTEKRQAQRGTLLIDVSASMTISEYQLDRLLDIVPMLTVALYSSDLYTYFSGMLVIVANKERRCSKKNLSRYSGHGNVVDGPALRWLANQKHPRIWVSDGIVTGVGDFNHPSLSKEAYSISKKANILRVSKVSNVIEWFQHRATIRTNMPRFNNFDEVNSPRIKWSPFGIRIF